MYLGDMRGVRVCPRGVEMEAVRDAFVYQTYIGGVAIGVGRFLKFNSMMVKWETVLVHQEKLRRNGFVSGYIT